MSEVCSAKKQFAQLRTGLRLSQWHNLCWSRARAFWRHWSAESPPPSHPPPPSIRYTYNMQLHITKGCSFKHSLPCRGLYLSVVFCPGMSQHHTFEPVSHLQRRELVHFDWYSAIQELLLLLFSLGAVHFARSTETWKYDQFLSQKPSQSSM